MITAAAVVIALVVLVWKWGTISDAIQTKWFNTKTTSSQAHGDSATAFQVVADTAHAQGVVVRRSYNALTSSPRVRNNPVAMEVVASGKKVIAKSDTEMVNLRSANTQLQRQVTDLQTRGELPTPRAAPYADALYSFSNKRRPMINLRAGVDYRIFSHVSVKAEVGYMPPPVGAPNQSPEFVANIGGHFSFR